MDAQALTSLPLFPLPVVMLPGQSMPLHIFEPRYQEMVGDVMSGHGLVGLATLVDRDDAKLERADVHAVIAVGRILTHQPLGEGRCNVLLRFEGRVAFAEELALAPGGYRRVRVDALPQLDQPVPQAKWIRALLAQMMPKSESARASFKRLAAKPDQEMLAVLSDLALTDLMDRMRYLAAESASARGELVQRRLAERVAASHQPRGEA